MYAQNSITSSQGPASPKFRYHLSLAAPLAFFSFFCFFLFFFLFSQVFLFFFGRSSSEHGAAAAGAAAGRAAARRARRARRPGPRRRPRLGPRYSALSLALSCSPGRRGVHESAMWTRGSGAGRAACGGARGRRAADRDGCVLTVYVGEGEPRLGPPVARPGGRFAFALSVSLCHVQ